MFDISLLMRCRNSEGSFLRYQLEQERKKIPFINNIETTNACNMKCIMCPRTTKMTRPIETMSLDLFKKVADQSPKNHYSSTWGAWKDYCKRHFGIEDNEMSENHFYLYVISQAIILHGYGDPLLDTTIAEKIQYLTDKEIKSYFSCNPNNIQLDKTENILKAGLNYLKYSIDSTDDNEMKEIRGKHSDFTVSFQKILEVANLIEQKKYTTRLVLTMIETSEKSKEEFSILKEKCEGLNCYIYLKSLNSVWEYNNNLKNKSIQWNEPCFFPWYSITIKSNGDCVSCGEDFNNEIVFGNANNETLEEIWNSKKYTEFRLRHFIRNGYFGNDKLKCWKECDMHKFEEKV